MIITPQFPPQNQTEQIPQINFLDLFEAYAEDGFTPPLFNTWTGLSIIAGALERKVWLEWNPTLRYYPNIYVLLVAPPGQGKSTALNKGVGLLAELEKEKRIRFLPSQVTEARLIELMGTKGHFLYEGQQHEHCSGYYFASEASDSLKEIYGDITSTMTNFYDCPDYWQKSTKKDGNLTVRNACFNLLAGSTFEYLGRLITDQNITGGFASRLTYVVSKEERVRSSVFAHAPSSEEKNRVKAARSVLVDELRRINEMVGPFSATPEFGVAWQAWDIASQERRIALSSVKIKSLLVRMSTTMHKLCMILSAAESSDRILKVHHLKKAISLLATIEDQLPGVFREARSLNTQSPDGVKNSIIEFFVSRDLRGQAKSELLAHLTKGGFDSDKAEKTLKGYLSANILGQEEGRLKLLVNPKDYL